MKYIQTLTDLLSCVRPFYVSTWEVGIYRNVDSATKLLLDLADIGVMFDHPCFASVFPIVVTSYECALDCDVVINGGNERNNPLYSYNVGQFIESHKMKPAIVYCYNFPLINDLVPVYDIRCVFYHSVFTKDPQAVKEMKQFESLGLNLVETEYIDDDAVIYLPGIEYERSYPVRKVSYKFGRRPFGMKDVFDPFNVRRNLYRLLY